MMRLICVPIAMLLSGCAQSATDSKAMDGASIDRAFTKMEAEQARTDCLRLTTAGSHSGSVTHCKIIPVVAPHGQRRDARVPLKSVLKDGKN